MGRRPTPSGLSPDAESEVMTVRGVAQYLHCHYSTIYRLVEHRQLPGFRLGGNWRFLRSDIEKWIAAGGGRTERHAVAHAPHALTYKRWSRPPKTTSNAK